MGSEVAKVVQKAGLVEPTTVKELQRWGFPVPPPADGPEPDPNIVPLLIERAMNDEEFVRVRETDLELLQQYLNTQEKGVLHLEEFSGRSTDLDIVFGRTPVGEYILPWVEGDINEVLLDCSVKLQAPSIGCVELTSPKELYYGDKKVFTVWRGAACPT